MPGRGALDDARVPARTRPVVPEGSSELCAESILSRAVEHARIVDIKGPNMREYTANLKAEADKGYWD